MKDVHSTMGTRRSRVWALCLLLTLLTGCTWVVEVRIWNATGTDVVILSMDTKLNATSYAVNNGQVVKISVPYQLRVQHGTSELTYDFPGTRAPKAYRERLGINKYAVTFAVNPDYLLVMLRPGATNLAVEVLNQPQGYPVKPR